MGLGHSNSRQQKAMNEGGPKAFFLVIGRPPITYLRNPIRGPLIYHVEPPPERGLEAIERAQTVRNLFSISNKVKPKLVQSNQGDPDVGFNLTFVIDGTSKLTCTVDVFVGVRLELKKGAGLEVSSLTETQLQFHLCHQPGLTVGPAGLEFTCDEPVLLQQLQPPSMPEGRVTPTSLEALPGGNASAPVVIQVSYDAPAVVDDEGNETAPVRRQVFTQCLTFDPTTYNRLTNGPPCSITSERSRQFLSFDDEVYEVEDVYDTGDGGITASPQPGEEGATGGDDDDEANACVVCLTDRKDTTVLPCRHLCLCSGCASVIKQQSGKCPVCRGPIEKLMAR